MKLDLPNTTSAFISQGSAVVQVSTSGKNSGTVTITKDTVSVDDPNVNVKVASADLVADIAGNNTVIGITEKQLDVSVESSTGQTFTVAVNQETPQVSARVVDASSSSAPTNFVITTQTSDNQVQVREVARDGSETVVTKQASAETDLNSTKIELAPVLQVSTVKPGLPPLEDRDLKNPEYKADESFVPKTGLVVSKLAEVVVLSSPTTVPIKSTSSPEVMNSFGPTTLLPVSTTTVPPSSTTTTPTTLPTTTTVKPTTTTVKPVVRTTTTTTTTTVPPTTTTSSTTTTTSSTTTTTTTTTSTTTTTTTAPPIYSAPPDTTTTTTTSSTTTTTIAATVSSAPTSVTGTSGNAQVSLSWYAPSSNGGAAITDYVVQYSTSSSGSFTTFSDGTSTTTTAMVTGLANNTVYYFKVAAVNSAGTSSYSDVSSGVRPASVPPVVSSVTAGNGSLTFTWNAITHGGDNYRVYYGTDSTFNSAYTYTGTTATSYAVTGLTNGTTYYFRVAGWNNSVNPQIATTDWSTTASGVPGAASAPTSLTVSSGRTGMSVSWTAPSSNGGSTITDYVVQYTTSAGGSYTTFSDGTSTTTSATITGLTAGSTYYVRVAAVNTLTTGTYSSESSGVLSKTCASGGVCAVGDTGPGGGKIFLTPSSSGNSTGYWFEAAPTSWNGGADPSVSWCSNNNLEIGSNAQGTALGTGQGNTTAIVAVGKCTSGAAYQARNYNGGGLSDWFLPSEDELKALQAVQVTIGGFASATYWSSTEIALGRSGAFAGPTREAYPVHFPDGGSNLWYKYQSYYVRPVRMFSPSS
jgi:hypothetical protein